MRDFLILLALLFPPCALGVFLALCLAIRLGLLPGVDYPWRRKRTGCRQLCKEGCRHLDDCLGQ